jgi:hypothetical protein
MLPPSGNKLEKTGRIASTALLTSPGVAHPGVDISMLCASYFVWTASPLLSPPFLLFLFFFHITLIL